MFAVSNCNFVIGLCMLACHQLFQIVYTAYTNLFHVNLSAVFLVSQSIITYSSNGTFDENQITKRHKVRWIWMSVTGFVMPTKSGWHLKFPWRLFRGCDSVIQCADICCVTSCLTIIIIIIIITPESFCVVWDAIFPKEKLAESLYQKFYRTRSSLWKKLSDSTNSTAECSIKFRNLSVVLNIQIPGSLFRKRTQ